MKHFLRQLAKASIILAASVFLFLGVTNPALAMGSSSSHPSKGTAQMNALQETSRQAVKGEPRSQSQVQRQAQQGPNEVQGSADLDKMNTPNNSRESTTVRKQVENVLEDITPGK